MTKTTLPSRSFFLVACGFLCLAPGCSKSGSSDSTNDGDGDGDVEATGGEAFATGGKGVEMGGGGSTSSPAGGHSASGGTGTGGDGMVDPLECELDGARGCDKGENCALTADGTKCIPIGTTPEGGSCESTADCGKDLFCVTGPQGSQCVSLCEKAADCSGDGFLFCTGLDTQIEEVGVIGVCLTECDIFVQDCPGNAGCYLGICQDPTAGLGGQGVSCFAQSECVHGMDCLVSYIGDDTPECAAYCEPANDTCDGGLHCEHLNNLGYDLDIELGLCVE